MKLKVDLIVKTSVVVEVNSEVADAICALDGFGCEYDIIDLIKNAMPETLTGDAQDSFATRVEVMEKTEIYRERELIFEL